MLWCSQPVFLNVGDEVPELVNKEDGHSDQACDANGEEAEAYLANIEAVDGWVDEWEHLKEGIINSVRERSLWCC